MRMSWLPCMATEMSAGVSPEVNLMILLQASNKAWKQDDPCWLSNLRQMSPEILNRGFSGPTKRTSVFKIKKKEQYHHPNRTGTSGGGLNNFYYYQPRMPLSPRNGISREGLRTMTIPENPPIKIGISHRGLRNLRIWPTQITTPPSPIGISYGGLCVVNCVWSLCALWSPRIPARYKLCSMADIWFPVGIPN